MFYCINKVIVVFCSPDAITGKLVFVETNLIKSRSYPDIMPSLSIEVISNSPVVYSNIFIQSLTLKVFLRDPEFP